MIKTLSTLKITSFTCTLDCNKNFSSYKPPLNVMKDMLISCRLHDTEELSFSKKGNILYLCVGDLTEKQKKEILNKGVIWLDFFFGLRLIVLTKKMEKIFRSCCKNFKKIS